MRQTTQRSGVSPMIAITEEIYYEGGPAKGDLIMNLLAAIQLCPLLIILEVIAPLIH